MSIIRNNLKKILLGIVILIILPLLSVVMRVLYIYGTYVGTYARNIAEVGICE